MENRTENRSNNALQNPGHAHQQSDHQQRCQQAQLLNQYTKGADDESAKNSVNSRSAKNSR